jgi:hypothetical protein
MWSAPICSTVISSVNKIINFEITIFLVVQFILVQQYRILGGSIVPQSLYHGDKGSTLFRNGRQIYQIVTQ